MRDGKAIAVGFPLNVNTPERSSPTETRHFALPPKDEGRMSSVSLLMTPAPHTAKCTPGFSFACAYAATTGDWIANACGGAERPLSVPSPIHSEAARLTVTPASACIAGASPAGTATAARSYHSSSSSLARFILRHHYQTHLPRLQDGVRHPDLRHHPGSKPRLRRCLLDATLSGLLPAIPAVEFDPVSRRVDRARVGWSVIDVPDVEEDAHSAAPVGRVRR
ncbi:hypothetical protein C8R45DRAFT_1082790 [Mycena sanguinolenta]|nr:hypothetical protein C8R45DRAFT_1082790 [Mycena sanguinolenta]